MVVTSVKHCADLCVWVIRWLEAEVMQTHLVKESIHEAYRSYQIPSRR